MRLMLSAISTKHSTLKKHWSESSQSTQCPLTVLGSYEKPKEDTGGLVCLLEDLGVSQKTVDLKMAAGMVANDKGIYITAFNGIHEVDPTLGTIEQNAISSPLFNALHSISRTERGYLVASTGLDLLLEFNHKGEMIWNWWATDHGFELTPTGKKREIDKAADHRSQKYGTLMQTTHVNSAAELPDGRVLATLFHQGMVIIIDRQTGKWQPVLDGLDHPHSVRVLDKKHFTVADTVRGRALLVRLNEVTAQGHIEYEIDTATKWLQDCQYDQEHDTWIVVDGTHSRIVLRRGRSGESIIAQFELDPEWRLYEAHVLS